MTIPPFSWSRFIALLLGYWVLVIGGWAFYVTHRSTQRRVVHARNAVVESWDPATGRLTLKVTHKVNLLPICAVLLGAPIVALVAWLVLGKM